MAPFLTAIPDTGLIAPGFVLAPGVGAGFA